MPCRLLHGSAACTYRIVNQNGRELFTRNFLDLMRLPVQRNYHDAGIGEIQVCVQDSPVRHDISVDAVPDRRSDGLFRLCITFCGDKAVRRKHHQQIEP